MGYIVSCFLAVVLACGVNCHEPYKSSCWPYMPLNGLPDPADIVPRPALRTVALGIGHQNYTCTVNSTAASIGATASLFNTTKLVFPSSRKIDSLTTLTLLTSDQQFLSGTGTPSDNSSAAVDLHPASPGGIWPFGMKPLGIHYFPASSGLPFFDLSANEPAAQILATKLKDVPAPWSAFRGLRGEGAVDWLQLGNPVPQSSFGGLRFVYRVETAGGAAPADACVGTMPGTVISVPYTAQYWFWG